MSYLQQQMDKFNAQMASAASRLPQQRRTVAGGQTGTGPAATTPATTAGTTTPTTTATTTPATNGETIKKKRHDSDIVYSQPANTGTGKDIMTNVHFAISKMKEKNYPFTFEDIIGFLSLQHRRQDHGFMHALRSILQMHERVHYDPKGADGKGTYSFRPPHNIRSEEQLLAKLQSQTTAAGLSVKELKEGWPDVEEAINRMEREGKVLVTRNKKDNHARMVWANDPSLMHTFDEEFRQIWDKIKIPDQQKVIEELEKAGITPTSKHKVVKPRPKVEQKKPRKQRRSGKTTNTHMMGILRDYSHLHR